MNSQKNSTDSPKFQHISDQVKALDFEFLTIEARPTANTAAITEAENIDSLYTCLNSSVRYRSFRIERPSSFPGLEKE